MPNTRLDGWKSIAAYTARSERQLQRWAVERGFPVHRVPGGGSVFAWTDEIDAWFVSSTAGKTALQEESSNGNPEPANGAPPSQSISVQSATDAPPRSVPADAATSTRQLLVTLVAGVALGAAGTWVGIRQPAPAAAPPSVSAPPCHVVDWPTAPLSARGGRFPLAVRATASPCGWQQPVMEATWLLITPPSFTPTPPRVHGNGITPFALPPYNPAASYLWLEVAGNRQTAGRSAAVYVGDQRISITQEGARDTCVSIPGPGFVHDGWRYRITASRYDESADLMKAVRAEVGPQAQPVSWADLATSLDGHPDAGVAFADAVGLARQTWDEDFEPENCLHYWLPTPYRAPSGSYPDFLAYHLNRKQASFMAYYDFNDNQFDLGRFHGNAQVLFRELVK